jgi:hypothetical protein
VDHIIVVQERVLGPGADQLAAAAPSPLHPGYQRVDDIVIYQIPNRLLKFPSPMQPAGALALAPSLQRLSANYARLIECLESTPNLRRHSIPSPPIKAVSGGAYESMDGYQWILAAAAHTERHTKQILEVMADLGYPA